MVNWAKTKNGRLGAIFKNNGSNYFVKPFDSSPDSRETWLKSDVAEIITPEQQALRKKNRKRRLIAPKYVFDDGCPQCQTPEPSYISGVDCPNCGYNSERNESHKFKDYLMKFDEWNDFSIKD